MEVDAIHHIRPAVRMPPTASGEAALGYLLARGVRLIASNGLRPSTSPDGYQVALSPGQITVVDGDEVMAAIYFPTVGQMRVMIRDDDSAGADCFWDWDDVAVRLALAGFSIVAAPA